MTHGILILSAAIAGIALDGVDNAVLNTLDDTHMVGQAILWPEPPLLSQSKKIIMPGFGSTEPSSHRFCPRNQLTPVTQPENFGIIPASI